MKALLLEDDPAIAQTLIFALKKDGFEPLWSDSLSKGIELFCQHDDWLILILDVGLPDGTGFEFCQKVRAGEHLSAVPIVFLTARTDEVERVLGLELGADDYIAKPFSPKELIARIKSIFRRQELTLKEIKNQSDGGLEGFEKLCANHLWCYNADQYRLSLDGIALPLSKTELALMLAFLANSNRILSREQLLALMSEHPEHRLARTVDAHIKSLRQKLASICDEEIIITHRGVGYGIAG